MRPTLLSLSLPAVPPCLRESTSSFSLRRGTQTRNRFKAATIRPADIDLLQIIDRKWRLDHNADADAPAPRVKSVGLPSSWIFDDSIARLE